MHTITPQCFTRNTTMFLHGNSAMLDNAEMDEFDTFLGRARHVVLKVGGAKAMAEEVSKLTGKKVWSTAFQNMVTPAKDKPPMRSSAYTDEMAMVAGVSREWLKSGIGDPYKKDETPTEHLRANDSAEPHYHVRHAAPAPDGNEKLGLCLVDIPCESSYIPIFNATASMGLGRDLPEIEYQVGAMQLSHAWLRQHLNISNTNNLAVISADGDSMAPTFSSGDLLLIDRQVDQIKTDAIYALAMDDQLYVKRLARDIGDGSVNIISDNPAYGTQRITRERAEQLRVVGRVVFAWRGAKL